MIFQMCFKTGLRIILLCLLSTPISWGIAWGSAAAELTDTEQTSQLPLPIKQLKSFTAAFDLIRDYYVEEVSDEQLFEYAIRGMVAGLDPHSSYLNQKAYKNISISTSGEYGGLGLEVSMEKGYIKVIAPLDDSPAAEAGIQAGDLITRLNGNSIIDSSLDVATQLMRGKPGTQINLTLVRENVTEPIEVTLTREIIQTRSAGGRILQDKIGYMRISQFQLDTGKELAKQITRLQTEHPDLQAYVLDLRNNPGGALASAVAVTDLFLKEGMIVYTDGRQESDHTEYKATPGDAIDGAPLVIMVNRGTASASEIVAGALKDHQRAIILGTTTFGKGSVQTIIPLTNDNTAALKLTTARYFTPSGDTIQAQGIQPDIVVKNLKVKVTPDPATGPLREADLKGHLSKGDQAGDNSPIYEQNEKVTDSDLIENDYQLYQAVNILKGMIALNRSDK